jgi:hypothetical protein
VPRQVSKVHHHSEGHKCTAGSWFGVGGWYPPRPWRRNAEPRVWVRLFPNMMKALNAIVGYLTQEHRAMHPHPVQYVVASPSVCREMLVSSGCSAMAGGLTLDTRELRCYLQPGMRTWCLRRFPRCFLGVWATEHKTKEAHNMSDLRAARVVPFCHGAFCSCVTLVGLRDTTPTAPKTSYDSC